VFLICIFTILFYSCHHDNLKDIIKVFQPVYIITKPITTKTYENGEYSNSLYLNNGGSHFANLFLNSDTTFTYYNSNTTLIIGQWHVIKDCFELIPFTHDKSNVSYHLKLSKSTNSPIATFIVLDKTEQPIENFIIQPFNSKPFYNYDSNGNLITDKTNENKLLGFPERFSTDNTGTIRLNKIKFDSLEFTKLYLLTRKKFRIGTRNLPDTIKLFININAIALFEPKINFINLSSLPVPHLKFIIRNDKFIIPFD
jgi:hypothetical protein